MTVIDLDEPVRRRPGRTGRLPRGWRRALFSIGLLIVGGVIGGGIGASTAHGRAMQTFQEAQESQVSVVVIPVMSATPGPTDNGRVTVGGRVTDVGIFGQLTVVNAGPMPVNVQSISVDGGWLTVRAMNRQRWIQPGTALRMDVDVQVDCLGSGSVGMLDAALVVETVHQESRALPSVTFDGAPWNEQVERACAGED